MATSKQHLDFILEQLGNLGTITYRPMMGEYLLYSDGILFGGIYDNRLLIKKTGNNAKFNLPEVIPYDRAKPMYQIIALEDCENLRMTVLTTVSDLKN